MSRINNVILFVWLENNGKSLLELMISLAIVSFVLLVAAVSNSFISEDRIRSFSRELYGDLIKLRYSSMTNSHDKNMPNLRGYGIRFQNSNTYYLFRVNDKNQDFFYSGADEEAPLNGEGKLKEKEIPETLRVQIKEKDNLNNPHDNVLIFDRHGLPRQPSGAFQLMTLVIESIIDNKAQKKCISIAFTRIREGLWDGKDCLEQ